MGLISGTKKFVKPLVNFPQWMNWEGIKRTTVSIAQVSKNLFIPQKAQREESFAEALERLHLTEADIQQRLIEFKRLLAVLLASAFSVLVYIGYLIYQGHGKALIISTILLLIILAQAFRYHFWIFQIKQRKLGCNIHEWFYKGLLGR